MLHAVSLKLFRRQLHPLLVEVVGVEVAVGSHGPDEAVGEWPAASTTFDHYRSRPKFQLHQNHADVCRVDHLGSVGQRLGANVIKLFLVVIHGIKK